MSKDTAAVHIAGAEALPPGHPSPTALRPTSTTAPSLTPCATADLLSIHIRYL